MRWLICGGYINVEYSGLHKSVEMNQGLIIRQVEHVVGFEKFIESTQWACGLAGDELLVDCDVEGVNPVLDSTNSEDVWLFSL